MPDNRLVRLLDGKNIVSPDRDRLAALRERSGRVVVDVGTGDARLAYRVARVNPDWLVIGLDPNWQRMTGTAVRSKRKPARGGVANLLLVVASIEALPDELAGLADEVLVMMPWGRLLRGLVLGEPDVCGGVRRVAKPGAEVEVVIGTSIWREPVPVEIRDLPEPTGAYLRDTLAPRWAASGLLLVTAGPLAGGETLTFGDAPGSEPKPGPGPGSAAGPGPGSASGSASGSGPQPGEGSASPVASPVTSPVASSWARRLGASPAEQVLRLAARAG